MFAKKMKRVVWSAIYSAARAAASLNWRQYLEERITGMVWYRVV